ncbi:class I poly(R)-hydroxyalkanoic acid synthase [Cupriavidus basilensis]|uniref:class I poly(R)-hydroxyalkanoic acid synthase n=1 Tax=Cupriavidus basilensis TaxID=68895 RepID=UPI0023E77334|nr:class I poly(R)-hydroxyalkanoic acid synthase [Cupriavidus basilensis]MDF3888069.1 class I poly(R)-hydroxyalkanoic acid synthase [Cupriavidus basilensis]
MSLPLEFSDKLLQVYSAPFKKTAEYMAGQRFFSCSMDFSGLLRSNLRYLEGQAAVMRSVWSEETDGEKPDRRFAADEWNRNPWYRFLKKSYLNNARTLSEITEAIGIEEDDKSRLRFLVGQYIESLSPANFLGTNPEAIQLALESQGGSLVSGLANYVEDARRGRIAITDESAFEVGRNVATSEGAVVFECELMQLIQYKPLTDKVASRPLVIVPPCINKFYILDLQPENSFVRFACEQGHTVFLVSWRNPQADMSETTWDDYVEHGVLKALEVSQAISGAAQVNALGWCVGGTLLTSALGVQQARGKKTVASMTLLTTMLDFSEPGELGVFIDEPTVAQREQTIGRSGIYPGKELAFVFQMLRPNDLIWPYFVGNYLKGQSPGAFDLLYWNADATNLAGPMYAWYLRNMYLENKLREPGQLTVCGHPMDLGSIDVPNYILATKDDHIVPWQSAYRSVQLLGGKSEFVLGESGHIAGVINPASKQKRGYWRAGERCDDADGWLASATSTPGSWWVHWAAWLKRHAGKQVAAPARLGNDTFEPIEPAPGRYVSVRAD